MELQDHLKSEWSHYFCNQPPVEFDPSANHRLLCDGMLYNYNCENDSWDSEESQEEESALDSVELLDVEDDAEDEENWLYECPKKQEGAESALGWCRHVLDNPSRETEAACRSLMNRLDQRSSSRLYRRPEVFHHTGSVSMSSSVDRTSISTTDNTSDGTDNKELNISHDSISPSYRLQDITDVHIMARIQEASLRQDYASMPATASSRRGPEPTLTTMEITDDITPGNKPEASSSPPWWPALSSLSSSTCQSQKSVAQQSCRSPKLARLHQQVTQFKLLKLAQNQAASAGRTRSPLQTSLRSLQAVRNSRSLETDDSDSQISDPPLGASSVRTGSSSWSPSPSAPSMNSNGSLQSGRDSSDRTSAVKRQQRSQSISPCRIPHPAKAYLSVHGRVFASPERSASVAWGRNVPSTQR